MRNLPLPGARPARLLLPARHRRRRAAAGPARTPGASVVIIGAGYIGLEVAAVAAKRGLKVTVLEALPRVMARAACPEISAFYEDAHRKAGVDIRCNTKLEAIEKNGDALMVERRDGPVAADIVLIGVGIVPERRTCRRSPG